MSNKFLCSIKDFNEEGCKGISLSDDEEIQEIFIINRNNNYFAYKNRCPHTGASLNWQPDVFLDYDKFYIQCAIHAARFEVETGLCVWGPCVNQRLEKIDIKIINNDIFQISE